MTINKRQLESVLDKFLEFETFEEFLSRFDVSVEEAFEVLFDAGFIDPVLLEELS